VWFGLSGVVALVVVVAAAAAAVAAAAIGKLLLGWDCSLASRKMDVGVPGTVKGVYSMSGRF